MITLPADFDAMAAIQFYDVARGEDLSQDLRLNAEGVAKIGTLGVQTLLSLEKTLQQQGKALHVDNASKEFKDVLEELGLGDALKRWGAAS